MLACMIEIPERFNKNAFSVRRLGSPAETGSWLIDYMCQRLGISDLGSCDVLDFGCGSRFAESFVNLGLPIRSYVGIDVDREMIDWLEANIPDPHLSFFWWNAHNPVYNSTGVPISQMSLPTGDRRFDVMCMFSVITHQLPGDTEAILRLLRQSIRPDGSLFFSVNLQDIESGYTEMRPEPTDLSAYSLSLLSEIVRRTGWNIFSIEPKNPPRPAGGVYPILDSLLCTPV
jgi:SAM-dependent methyltransferase